MHVSVLKKCNFFLNRDQILIYVYFTTISYILACYHLFIERRVTDNLYVIACVWLAWITFNCLAWRRNVMLHLYLKLFCVFFSIQLKQIFHKPGQLNKKNKIWYFDSAGTKRFGSREALGRVGGSQPLCAFRLAQKKELTPSIIIPYQKKKNQKSPRSPSISILHTPTCVVCVCIHMYM